MFCFSSAFVGFSYIIQVFFGAKEIGKAFNFHR
jgi:hypothetical protein